MLPFCVFGQIVVLMLEKSGIGQQKTPQNAASKRQTMLPEGDKLRVK